ncbi:MAG: urease accessory protein UreE, partial [Thiohalomonadales bacterium]
MMPLKIQTTLAYQKETDDVLTLPFELRQKSRFKARLESGTEVGLFLKRGNILRNGDILQAENGLVIRLTAANESLSTVTCSDPLQLAKLCYHLGNRHVPLQIEAD